MANDFDNTALNSTVRELWDEKVEEARYATAVIANRVSNKSGIAQKKGDIIHVTVDQRFTIGTVAADGSYTPQNYALSTVDITLNQHEQVVIRILDRAEAQSFWTPDSTFPNRVGQAFGSRYDAQLAALHSGVAAGNSVGSTATPADFDKTMFQEAMLKLAQSNIPLEDLSWIMHPAAYYSGLTNEAQLTAALDSGQPKNVLTTGYKFPLFGVPVYHSTNIVSTGSPAVYKNLLVHKSAIAIAWQKNTEIKRADAFSAGVFGTLIGAQSLYGLSVIRPDHFVVANSKV